MIISTSKIKNVSEVIKFEKSIALCTGGSLMKKSSQLFLGIIMTLIMTQQSLASLPPVPSPQMAEKVVTTPLRQKIGQMIMIGVHGTQPQDAEVTLALSQVEKGDVGGVLFFAYNIKSPQQVKKLTRAFSTVKSPEPILIAIDQEGGKVQRLKKLNGFTDYASAYQVAQTKSIFEAKIYYKILAQEIKNAGFNLNFAPVVDLHGSPSDPHHKAACPVVGGLERSFGNELQIVVNYAKAFMVAHHEVGLLTSLKHYPGHGLAQNDSHKGLVDITTSYDPLEREPFRHLIAQGVVDTVMTAHLVHREVDPTYPSTLSQNFIEPWLRHEDGFHGVVVTDDLNMGAIQQHYKLKEIVLRAIMAGNDILVFSNNALAAPEVKGFKADATIASKVIHIVEQAIADGQLSEDRINASFIRILNLKSRLQPNHG
jgi:beta-N-acetylhexosaminidase